MLFDITPLVTLYTDFDHFIMHYHILRDLLMLSWRTNNSKLIVIHNITLFDTIIYGTACSILPNKGVPQAIRPRSLSQQKFVYSFASQL